MDLQERLLETRPYSWMGTILIGIAAHVLVTQRLTLSLMFGVTVLVSWLMWIAGSTVPEYMRKRYEYGSEPNLLFALLPVVVVAGIALFFNPVSLFFVGLFFVGTMLYIGKVKYRTLGMVSFLFRGVAEISLILLIFSVHNTALLPEPGLEFMAAVYCMTASRNLVGDLRDVGVDENTFAVYSFDLAHTTSMVLAIVPILLILQPLIVFPLGIAAFFTVFLGGSNPYTTHRLYVICSLFFVANYIISLLGGSLILSNMVFIGVLLNFTYDDVPRKIQRLSASD